MGSGGMCLPGLLPLLPQPGQASPGTRARGAPSTSAGGRLTRVRGVSGRLLEKVIGRKQRSM